MVDPISARQFWYRCLFVALVFVLVFIRLLPIDTVPGGFPGPDLILALTMAWVLRRPAFVPAPLIVAVFLTCDLLFQEPPGLWAMLVLLGTEFLRAKQALSRQMPFLVEWAIVVGVLAAIVAANQIILSVLLVDTPPLGMAVARAIFTALVYPIVVGASYLVFDIRKASPEEAAALGARL